MAKEWTDDEVQAFIRETIGIAREDKIMSSVKGLHERLDKLFPGGNPTDDPADGGKDDKTPPKTDPKPSSDPATKPKRSLWWGEVSE
jgi:hypothetical protein